MLWSCPQCGNSYFYKMFTLLPYNPWVRECRHCGLPKWKEPEKTE